MIPLKEIEDNVSIFGNGESCVCAKEKANDELKVLVFL